MLILLTSEILNKITGYKARQKNLFNNYFYYKEGSRKGIIST